MRSPKTTLSAITTLIGAIIVALANLIADTAPEGTLTEEQISTLKDSESIQETVSRVGTVVGAFITVGGVVFGLAVARDDNRTSEGEKVKTP